METAPLEYREFLDPPYSKIIGVDEDLSAILTTERRYQLLGVDYVSR
jgi:hypothetical protein